MIGPKLAMKIILIFSSPDMASPLRKMKVAPAAAISAMSSLLVVHQTIAKFQLRAATRCSLCGATEKCGYASVGYPECCRATIQMGRSRLVRIF
jgi:hypothetical protein